MLNNKIEDNTVLRNVEDQFRKGRASETFWWILSIQTFTGAYQIYEFSIADSDQQKAVTAIYCAVTLSVFFLLWRAKVTDDKNKYYACGLIQLARLLIRPWDIEGTRLSQGTDWYMLVTYHCCV